MATTDARPGFRLPWSSDQRPADDSVAGDDTRADGSAPTDAGNGANPAEADTMTEGIDTAPARAGAAMDAGRSGAAGPAPRRQSKFLADLTKAMQATAEAAREEALTRLQADAKTHVEEIHARSTTEAADLRRRADDDVAAIREWSKTEIARIREETETRITGRKGRLESEIEEHGAFIERQVERVQARVAAFEQEMTTFFQRLLAEEDPTRFASMAENLPEPPPLDAASLAAPGWSPIPPPDARDPWRAPDAHENGPTGRAPSANGTWPDHGGAETDATAEDEAPFDPRLSALGLSAGFDAAEAEAFAAADAGDEEIPTISDDALAARLADLVPGDEAPPAPAAPAASSVERSTRVVVTGLVSVASIASFKRHLGRLEGVQSVGVSSGPDGEFVFTVRHADGLALQDGIATLPGFQARVTGGSDDVIEVAAKDPESEA